MFKNGNKSIAAVSILCCLMVFVWGAEVFGSEKQPLWPHEQSELKPDSAVKYGKLANGFRYVLMKNTTPEDRVSMHLAVQTGSLNEYDSERGTAHYLEHMMFNGTTHFEPGELVKFFQSIGMEFGPDANAHTSFNKTVYDIVLPEGDADSIEKGLLVFKDYAAGALLKESEIDQERKIILNEKRTRDSASYRTFKAVLKFELPNTLIPERMPIGVEEVLKAMDRKTLKEFYDAWYRPKMMFLVMAGDFDPEAAVPMIEDTFGDLEARVPKRTEPDIGTISHSGIKPFYHYEPESGSTRVSIEVISEYKPEPDSVELQKRILMENMACRIVQDELDSLLSKPETPFTSASIGTATFLNAVKYSSIDAECAPEKRKQTLFAIEQTLRKALVYGFSQNEFDRVKKDILAGLENAVKRSSTRQSRMLAGRLVSSVIRNRVFMSPEQEKAMFEPILEAITPEHLHRVFKENWSTDHRLVIVTGNCEIEGDSDEKIISEYKASTEIKIPEPQKKEPVQFPYLPIPENPGKITKKCEFEDLGIVQIDFENGVRLNLKKTDFEANEVLGKVSFGWGNAVEPASRPGLSALAESVINESGTGGLKKDDLERALAGKSTSVAFQVGGGSFSFSGRTVPDELELLFQLWFAYLKDPICREEAYNLVKKRYRQQYHQWEHSVNGMMRLEVDRYLADGDSRFGMPPFDRFKTLTAEHVEEWLFPRIEQEPLEISIVGDFDVDRAVDFAGRYFGSLEKRSACDQGPLRNVNFPEAGKLNLDVDTKIKKGLVIKAFPTDDQGDINRTRRLSVLSGVISERLRVDIREKLGASYTSFAFNRSSQIYDEYGGLQIRVYTKPEDKGAVIAEIPKIVEDLFKNGVSEDELKRTLEPAITGIKDMRQKNRYWLESVLVDSKRYPEQIEWSRSITSDYKSVAAAEISELAKRYLVDDKSVWITIMPVADES